MTARLPVFWDIQNLHIFVVCEGLVAVTILNQKLTYSKLNITKPGLSLHVRDKEGKLTNK